MLSGLLILKFNQTWHWVSKSINLLLLISHFWSWSLFSFLDDSIEKGTKQVHITFILLYRDRLCQPDEDVRRLVKKICSPQVDALRFEMFVITREIIQHPACKPASFPMLSLKVVQKKQSVGQNLPRYLKKRRTKNEPHLLRLLSRFILSQHQIR